MIHSLMMRGFRVAALAMGAVGLVAGCAAISGLADLQKDDCAFGCDAGATEASGPDAAPDGEEGDAGVRGDAPPGGGCALGALRCADAGVETCDPGGQWGSITPCGNQACVEGQCTGVCAPGQTQCSTNGVETCNIDGQWSNPVACGAATCVSGRCAGTCAPGQTLCTDGGVEACGAGGRWGTPTACGSQTCVSGQCTGVCAPGQTQCSGNGVETCGASGQWGNPASCNSSTCSGGQCAGSCTSGQTQCSGNGVQTCGAQGQWGSPAACLNQACVSGQCTGVCAPGQVSCNAAMLQTCDSAGQWQTSQTCPVACCSGACVDTTQDPSNCGGCGQTCGGGTACGTGFTAFTGTLPANWIANGSATYNAAVNAAQLTDLNNWEAGSWIYANPIQIDVATVQFDFWIGGGGADGMGLLFETNGAHALGGAGGGLGMVGLNGVGVEIDEYNNGSCLDDTANHIGIDLLGACNGGQPSTQAVDDSPGITVSSSSWHTMVVHVVNGAFTVTTDGISDFTSFTPAGWANGPYYLGFGGATGGANNYHRVRNVNVSFQTPRCF